MSGGFIRRGGLAGMVGGALWALTPLREPLLGGRFPEDPFFRPYNLVLLAIPDLVPPGGGERHRPFRAVPRLGLLVAVDLAHPRKDTAAGGAGEVGAYLRFGRTSPPSAALAKGIPTTSGLCSHTSFESLCLPRSLRWDASREQANPTGGRQEVRERSLHNRYPRSLAALETPKLLAGVKQVGSSFAGSCTAPVL